MDKVQDQKLSYKGSKTSSISRVFKIAETNITGLLNLSS